MNIVKEVRLIWTDADVNHNKFWHGFLFDNNDVKVEWGRVGYGAQTKTHVGVGASKLDKLEKEKTAKGYRPQRTISGTTGNSSSPAKIVASSNLADVATKEIGYKNPRVAALVKWLAEVNIHQIVANTKITFNAAAGTFSTPLGLVTNDGIDDARLILDKVVPFVDKHDFENAKFKQYVMDYMTIIPQDVGMGRGWHRDIFEDAAALRKQTDILDSLSASLQQAVQPVKSKDDGKPVARTFEVDLDIVDKGSEIDRIRNFFKGTKGNHHDVATLDVKNVYQVRIPTIADAFERDGRKVGNIFQLWHGTKASNLLSILKVGLIIPRSGAPHVTGRMFGDGLYFSDQSTKSLRYATNAWTRGGNSDRTFMFLCDVAMGKAHTPSNTLSHIPSGYDSCFAKAGKSGVSNNEMIVYRTSQANLVHLIEFTPYGK